MTTLSLFQESKDGSRSEVECKFVKSDRRVLLINKVKKNTTNIIVKCWPLFIDWEFKKDT